MWVEREQPTGRLIAEPDPAEQGEPCTIVVNVHAKRLDTKYGEMDRITRALKDVGYNVQWEVRQTVYKPM